MFLSYLVLQIWRRHPFQFGLLHAMCLPLSGSLTAVCFFLLRCIPFFGSLRSSIHWMSLSPTSRKAPVAVPVVVVLTDSGVVAHVPVITKLPVLDCLCSGRNIYRASVWGESLLETSKKNEHAFQPACVTQGTCTSLPSQPSPSWCSPSLMGGSANAATVGVSSTEMKIL